MSAFVLKLIAVVSMLIDHAAYSLFLAGVFTGKGYVYMRAVGRIAFPIFAYMIVNGFEKTHDVRRYFSRLALFAVISQPVYRLAFTAANYGAQALTGGGITLSLTAANITAPCLAALIAAAYLIFACRGRVDLSLLWVCAALVLWQVAKRWKVRVDADSLLTVVLCAIVGVILGGRLGYVLVYGDGYYFSHPAEILAFSHGGMSFHGGLIGALLSGIVAARFTGIPYLPLADMGCIAAPLGVFFGRCANFVNGELWGAPTSLPWGVVFGGTAGVMPRHPSQLYEALLEGVVLFCVLYILSRKQPPRPQGTFLGVFLVGYGLFRFLIEFVRQPDAQIGYLWGGWLTMGQVLSVPLMVAGACALVYAVRVKKPQKGLPEMIQKQ